jgi:acyl-coenzyme A thioesterase PaaI-like protein
MSSARRAEAVALLDAAMAQVAHAQFGADAEPVAVDVHVVFLAALDGPLAARAQVSGGGRSVCFCEGEASDAQGRVVVRAMGTFRR